MDGEKLVWAMLLILIDLDLFTYEEYHLVDEFAALAFNIKYRKIRESH